MTGSLILDAVPVLAFLLSSFSVNPEGVVTILGKTCSSQLRVNCEDDELACLEERWSHLPSKQEVLRFDPDWSFSHIHKNP